MHKLKKKLTTGLILLSSFILVGCNGMTNQDAGIVTGSVAGGLLGSTIGGGSGQIMAIAAGAVAGALIGGAVGKNMDRNDQMRMEHALEENHVGRPAYWRNARSGVAYEVVPVRNVTWHRNQYCREYRTTAIINGRKQEMYGTACRRPDGSWRAVR